jgi:opacity protein-like surface antigen
MKKTQLVVAAIVAAFSFTNGLSAAEGRFGASPSSIRASWPAPVGHDFGSPEHDAFFHFGPSLYVLHFRNSGSSETDTYYGGSLGGGINFLESNVGRVNLSFDLGAYYWDEKGRDLKESTVAIPVLVTGAYEFSFANDALRLRLGPTLGGTALFVNAKERGHSSLRDSDEVFTYGATVGLTLNITSGFYLDLGYRFLSNTDIKFDKLSNENVKTYAHQVSLSLGWRF